MYRTNVVRALALIAMVVAPPVLAESLQGGGRLSAIDTARGTLRVDETQLQIAATSRVLDYGGKSSSIGALEVGMSVHYSAQAAIKPGDLPVLREIRMIPN
jgi:hypothetical protein